MSEELIHQVEASAVIEHPSADYLPGPIQAVSNAEHQVIADRAAADQTLRLAEHGASVLVVVNPLAGVVLECQRLLNQTLAYVPISEDRLRGEIVAALAVRPTGGA